MIVFRKTNMWELNGSASNYLEMSFESYKEYHRVYCILMYFDVFCVRFCSTYVLEKKMKHSPWRSERSECRELLGHCWVSTVAQLDSFGTTLHWKTPGGRLGKEILVKVETPWEAIIFELSESLESLEFASTFLESSIQLLRYRWFGRSIAQRGMNRWTFGTSAFRSTILWSFWGMLSIGNFRQGPGTTWFWALFGSKTSKTQEMIGECRGW